MVADFGCGRNRRGTLLELPWKISIAKRYDSIGSALADRVRAGSVVIPGHFRLGRLNQAAGGCGGGGLAMGVEWSFCLEWDLIGCQQGSEFCLAGRRSLQEPRFGVRRRGYRCLFFGFSHERTHLECKCRSTQTSRTGVLVRKCQRSGSLQLLSSRSVAQ